MDRTRTEQGSAGQGEGRGKAGARQGEAEGCQVGSRGTAWGPRNGTG
jgi:hypothetical protein